MFSLMIRRQQQQQLRVVVQNSLWCNQRGLLGDSSLCFRGNQNDSWNAVTIRTFAGHNKWSKIRHKKGAKDKARASLLGKASKAITVAAIDCGGDLSNLRLQSCIAHAKSVQLPKDRIDDAIQKALSKDNNMDRMEIARYDAMIDVGGTKVGCVISALTDNRNRTSAQVRHLVNKYGNGELLQTDKLSYLFQHVGMIQVEGVQDEDELLECALEGGATNVEQDDENESTWYVTTEDNSLWQVVTALKDSGYEVVQFEHRYILQDPDHGGISLSEEGEQQLEEFLDRMDENEDVSAVYHNAN